MVLKNVKPFEQNPRDFRIEWDKIESVYKGRLNACSCGCAGDYLYTQTYGRYCKHVNGNDILHEMTSVLKDTEIAGILSKMEARSSDVFYQWDRDGVILELMTDEYKEHYWEDDDVYSDEIIQKGYRVYLKWKSYIIPETNGVEALL